MKMVGYLSVKDQSVTGLVTRSPVSQSPGRRSLGSSPTMHSVTSATATQASSAPTRISRVFALPRMATIIPAAGGRGLTRLGSMGTVPAGRPSGGGGGHEAARAPRRHRARRGGVGDDGGKGRGP